MTRTFDMAQNESALGGDTNPPATPPRNTEQPSESITPSDPTALSSLQASKPSGLSHEDYPGVPYELIISTLSSHFDSLWESQHEPKEDEYDSDAENDMPLRYEGFESAFDLGDIVRVESHAANTWTEYMPGLDGYYSKQTFEIVGKWFKAGSWWNEELGQRETKTRAQYIGDDEPTFLETNAMHSNALSLVCTNESDSEDESDTAKKNPWESDCWMYKLEPIEPLQGFPVADVMLWKEENLMLDAEAMDDDSDDSDDDDHSDHQQRDVGGEDKNDVSFDYQVCRASGEMDIDPPQH
ncbi:hypothetical protein LTS15_010707 [Exophiala xenobiotica]|nr:hypothetical protein LTS15_010707 [Exophiala xenobiotica]